MSDTGVIETTDDLDDYPDDTKPAPKPKERPQTPFGWCLTGHHSICKKTLNDGKTVCPCTDCGDEHGADFVPQDGTLPDDLAAIVAKYSL